MKRIITFLIIVCSLLAWNELTNTSHYSGSGGSVGGFTFTEITDMATARRICVDGKPGFFSKEYTWAYWQVRIYIPGYGCVANDPTPQYIRIGGFEFTIDTWLKGFHRVEMYSVGF